jgi:hypothetical protein
VKKLKINSFDDPNFLKLGFLCIGIGLAVYILSFIFSFSGIIALRGGGGLGLIICAVHFVSKARRA